MTDWLTTILIFLPMAAALVIWLVPMPRHWIGSLATLVSLMEIGFWLSAVQHIDFDDPSLQLDQQHSWFSSLGVSYYVGQYSFSTWLVGLTVICGAVACGYAWWSGRERARAYFGLLLFLTGSVVGVLLRAGPAALLRVLRGDADPAVRADRRLGRRRSARARPSSSSSTRSPARC